MPKLEYTPQISLGNMLTIGAMVGGMLIAWGANEVRIASFEANDIAHSARLAAIEERVRANETGLTRTDERMVSIMASLGRIERQIEQLSTAEQRR